MKVNPQGQDHAPLLVADGVVLGELSGEKNALRILSLLIRKVIRRKKNGRVDYAYVYPRRDCLQE